MTEPSDEAKPYLPRTPEHNPHERLSDQSLWNRVKWWFWWGRGYRDIWLLAVTGLVVWSLVSIQDQRVDAATQACEEAKARNVDTRHQIDAQIAAITDPEQKKRAEANLKNTLLLIDAIVPPRENCRAYAENLVSGGDDQGN